MAKPPDTLGQGVAPTALETEIIDLNLEPNIYLPNIDTELIAWLFEEGLKKEWDNSPEDHFQLDRWLAPRLHATLRIPRRIASQRRFWAWIAMQFAARYVHERFAEDGTVNTWRYTGDLLRNAVSRLWWAAELLRNGPDYSSVDLGLRRVRTAQFALELKYSWFRPAAVGFVSVSEPNQLTDKEMSAVSVRANAYLPLEPLEAIAFSTTGDSQDRTWWEGSTTKKELASDSPPTGPQDGHVDPTALDEVVKWYRAVIDEEKTASKLGRGIEK